MNLLTIAQVPPIQVSPEETVSEAIAISLPSRVGAVAVVENGKLKGIFTERDVMLKVVHKRLDPQKTRVGAVMTAPVITVKPETGVKEVLEMMLDKHIRHLPVSSNGKTVEGMLSIRNVLQYMVERLQIDLNHMEAYITSEVSAPG